MRENRPERAQAQLDEVVIEPARAGARWLSFGLARVVGLILAGLGSAIAVFGALLWVLLASQIADVIGVALAALGFSATALGAFTYVVSKRLDARLGEAAVERRLLKLVTADAAVTDTRAALRVGVDIRHVRRAAEELVRAGVLEVEVEPSTGVESYRLATSVSADVLEAADFDRRLAEGTEQEIVEEERVSRQIRG